MCVRARGCVCVCAGVCVCVCVCRCFCLCGYHVLECCANSFTHSLCILESMAPKKSKAGQAAMLPGLGRLPAETYDPNVQHFKMIEECLQGIRDHPVFGPNIDTLDPLPLAPASPGDQAGFLAPLDNIALAAARASGGEYVCGVNLLWAKPLESVTPGVPIMGKALSDLVHRLMARGPKVVEDRLEFVFPGETDTEWRKCCPEESGAELPGNCILKPDMKPESRLPNS